MSETVRPEDMTIPELGREIEKQEYAQTEAPDEDKQALTARLAALRDLLRRRVEEKLGGQPDDPDVLPGYGSGDIPVWTGMEDLERPEDIVGCWHLFNDFPMLFSIDKMLQIEAELLRQRAALEAEEPAAEWEGTLGLWRYRWELLEEQLDQLRATMHLDPPEVWPDEDLPE